LPVADDLLDRVVVAGLDTRFEIGYGLPELVLDDLLRPALALETLALGSLPDVDGSRAPVALRVDGAFVLTDD
jgi:hypothetical protein